MSTYGTGPAPAGRGSGGMNPRSLVGMPQGPRKRAAWRKAVEKCGGTDDMDLVRSWYAEYREEYRIGERLRPCPGCPDCCEWAEPFDDGSYFLHDPEMSHPCDYSCDGKSFDCDEDGNPPPRCGGSGVLPAKKR